MKAARHLVSTLLLCSVASLPVHANLIQNGGFEDIGAGAAIGGYGSASTWQIYADIPDWGASQNVEIWTNDFIVPAYEGDNVLELNGHPGKSSGAFSIYQSFNTSIGDEYQLTFAGRKRQQHANESFMVSVGDLIASVYNQPWGEWTEYVYNFTASTELTTLTFTSLDGGADTTGNILDAISVVAVNDPAEVPEPGAMALLFFGVAGLAVQRRRLNKNMSE